MRIVNRAQRGLYWAAYRQDDGINAFRLSGKGGFLDAAQSVEMGMEQDSVRLRVGSSEGMGPVFAGPFVNTTLVVISASEKPVEMDDDAVRYSAIAKGGGYQTTRTNFASLNASSRAIASSVNSLISMLPSQLAPLKALAGLIMFALFDEQRPAAPPTLDDIKSALAQIVADALAQQDAAAVMNAWQWFNNWETKVAGLKAAGTVPTDFEVAAFDNDLDDLLGPNSQAFTAMLHLQKNPDARRSIIPTYLLGVSLFAKLQLVAVARVSLYRTAIPADYKPLQDFLAASRKAIDAQAAQLTNEYVGLLSRYDLGPCEEMRTIASGFNIAAIGTGCDADSPAGYLRDQSMQLAFLEQKIAAWVTSMGRVH